MSILNITRADLEANKPLDGGHYKLEIMKVGDAKPSTSGKSNNTRIILRVIEGNSTDKELMHRMNDHPMFVEDNAKFIAAAMGITVDELFNEDGNAEIDLKKLVGCQLQATVIQVPSEDKKRIFANIDEVAPINAEAPF